MIKEALHDLSTSQKSSNNNNNNNNNGGTSPYNKSGKDFKPNGQENKQFIPENIQNQMVEFN